MTKSGGQSFAPNSGGGLDPLPRPLVIYAHGTKRLEYTKCLEAH